MTEYFENLSKQCKEFHSLPRVNQLGYLYQIGFTYQDVSKIMMSRRYDTEERRLLKKKVEKHPFYTQKILCEIVGVTSGKLSSILTGTENGVKIVEQVKQILKNYEIAKRKRDKRNERENKPLV
jgi:hypothetical protein